MGNRTSAVYRPFRWLAGWIAVLMLILVGCSRQQARETVEIEASVTPTALVSDAPGNPGATPELSPTIRPTLAPSPTIEASRTAEPLPTATPPALSAEAMSFELPDGWPMVGANPERTSWTAEEVPGELRPLWFHRFDAYISQKIQPIAALDTLFISATDSLHEKGVGFYTSYMLPE